eukprot:jgi/Undpi1/5489/HiC_scaffold_2.g00768.m1
MSVMQQAGGGGRRPTAAVTAVAADTAASPMSFCIPLKTVSKPVVFPADFRKHIALEFAMRYLCELDPAGFDVAFTEKRRAGTCPPAIRTSSTQPASRMGKADPHKVSVFVDTVSASIGPSLRGSRGQASPSQRATATGCTPGRGRDGVRTKVVGSVGSKGGRGNRASTPGADGVGTKAGGDSRGNNGNRVFNGGGGVRARVGGGRDGGGRAYTTPSGSRGDRANRAGKKRPVPWGRGGAGRTRLLLAGAVDMAAISAIQTAFARGFPFQKHGKKFTETSVRSSLKDLMVSDGPARLIG